MAGPERRETDVVVLGTGAAGMAAVSAAARAGVEVLAVDACDDIGGNAVRSTGYVVVVGSDAQRAAGISDDTEAFLADARAAVPAGAVWDEGLARAFARGSARTERFLAARGVRFRGFVPRPGLNAVDRVAAVEDPAALGAAFRPDFARPTVTTLHRTFADDLVADGGRVTGVRVHHADTGVATVVTARRGVVVALGGYQAAGDRPFLGLDTCRGDGQAMGRAAGAALVGMVPPPALVMVSSSLVEDAIAVNLRGERFHDEAGPTTHRVERLRAQPHGRAWYVFDARTAAAKARAVEAMPQPPVRADTLAGLARRIGVPSSALERTVARWNAFLDGGATSDPASGRVVLPPGRARCERGPFTAVAMVEGVNFSWGGLRTTTGARVLDGSGEPIPGLYAAGDCAGGLNACSELGGIHLGGAFTLGRLAGLSAVRAGHPGPARAPARTATAV